MQGAIVASESVHTPNGVASSGGIENPTSDIGGSQIPTGGAARAAAIPQTSVVQHYRLDGTDAEARFRAVCEARARDVLFLEEEWVSSERRRAHSEQVAAMRDCMVGGQLADAHNRIQRLGSELVAAQATMRAQMQSWENMAARAEHNAAAHGEQVAAAAVRQNPGLAVSWADGQLVSMDTARSELIRVEQNASELHRAYEIAAQERLAESSIANR